jgi:hypothetical protein
MSPLSKILNIRQYGKICTDRLPKFTDSYFGEASFRSNDNVFNLTGSSLSSTHDENNETYDIFNELTELSKILNIRQYVDGLTIFLFPVMIFSGRPFWFDVSSRPEQSFWMV